MHLLSIGINLLLTYFFSFFKNCKHKRFQYSKSPPPHTVNDLSGAWCTTAGYTYDQTAAACYKVVSTPASWTDATAACTGDSGHLLKVDSDARYSFLVNQISM